MTMSGSIFEACHARRESEAARRERIAARAPRGAKRAARSSGASPRRVSKRVVEITA
jgi:hypothetical protein